MTQIEVCVRMCVQMSQNNFYSKAHTRGDSHWSLTNSEYKLQIQHFFFINSETKFRAL
jgi:hypothetical protein